jgi:hypothetical protein
VRKLGYLAAKMAVPAYKEVFTRGLDWPSLASAVTALEVNTWCELSQPRSEVAVLEKTA